jgi:hypothetical protein
MVYFANNWQLIAFQFSLTFVYGSAMIVVRRRRVINEPIELNTSKNRDRWRPAVIGCSVFVVFIILMLGVMLVSFYRSPYYRGLMGCRSNLKQAGDALGRYYIKNDKYPDRLAELAPEYVSASAFHCPKDSSYSQTISYSYEKVGANAPDDAVMLTCYHHKIHSVFPGVILRYLKGGEITIAPVPKPEK